MKDPSKTNQELIEENVLLTQRIQELEQSEFNRKKTEETLRDTKTRYRLLFEHSPDGIVIIEPATARILDFNDTAHRQLGYSREEFSRLSISDIDIVETHEETRSQIAKVIQRGRYDFETMHRTRQGEIRTVYVTAQFTEILGHPVYHCIWRDITEQKRIEKALTKSEEKFRKAFYTSPDAVNINRLEDGMYVSINPGFTKIMGYTEEDLIGKTSIEYKIWDNIEDRQRLIAGLRKDGEVANLEAVFRMKDGGIRYGLMSASLIDLDGVPHILNITRDITDRKLSEEALRASEERFRALSENAPDIIYTMNLEGAITYANPSWKRILGHDEEDLLGRYFTDFTREEDIRTYRKLFKSIRDDRTSVNNHIGVMLTKNGTERVFNMNTAFNRDSDDHIIGIVGTMKDITELRDMENKLHHAQKMESLGTLAGGIAHDFNNLLMGIQGYASLALITLDPSNPNYERLKKIEEQVQSGADLTKQLLGFARGGRYDVKPTDMNEIIKKTSDMFGRTKKEIFIHRKYDKDLWPVEVDRGQIEQIFMNLYVNAWQAMTEGGEIFLATKNVLLDDEQAFPYTINPGKYIKISMTDTGTGMDAKTRERIFDPFFTTKEIGRGTGLGLSMVYGIIKRHKGMIDVESEPGHGTTFTIYFPASDKEVLKEKTATGTIARGTETILIVDDEKMVLEVSKAMLESMGYRVYAAGSGQEAIAVYMEKRNEIDLVILDMIMPGLSGSESFDRLREINPGIKVLLSSGYSIEGQAQEIMDRGCKGFLQKPFNRANISRKVREILD